MHVFSPSVLLGTQFPVTWGAPSPRVGGFSREWPHWKGHSSTVRPVNESENLQLSHIYPSPDAVTNFVVTWARLGGQWYLPWNKQYVCVCGTRTPTGGPCMSMWQGVTPHSRLGFLISLPQCCSAPRPRLANGKG